MLMTTLAQLSTFLSQPIEIAVVYHLGKVLFVAQNSTACLLEQNMQQQTENLSNFNFTTYLLL